MNTYGSGETHSHTKKTNAIHRVTRIQIFTRLHSKQVFLWLMKGFSTMCHVQKSTQETVMVSVLPSHKMWSAVSNSRISSSPLFQVPDWPFAFFLVVGRNRMFSIHITSSIWRIALSLYNPFETWLPITLNSINPIKVLPFLDACWSSMQNTWFQKVNSVTGKGQGKDTLAPSFSPVVSRVLSCIIIQF